MYTDCLSYNMDALHGLPLKRMNLSPKISVEDVVHGRRNLSKYLYIQKLR